MCIHVLISHTGGVAPTMSGCCFAATLAKNEMSWKAVWWIAKKFGTDIRGAKMTNPTDLGDPLTLHVVAYPVKYFNISWIYG